MLAICALIFVAGAAATAVWCGSMSAMGEMTMPGGWAMSMAWMRMPGETWLGAAAMFVGMWSVMMIPMMLPSVTPLLWRYRRGLQTTGRGRFAIPIMLVGAGYFVVWAAFGVIVFPLGAALAEIEMQVPALSRVVPLAAGAVVLIAGVLQFTAWKARQLACCRGEVRTGHDSAADARSAWSEGLRAGLRCAGCCAPMMVILLVVGVMDWRAMTLVTSAITAERVAPAGDRIARAIGVVVVAAALLMIAHALGVE